MQSGYDRSAEAVHPVDYHRPRVKKHRTPWSKPVASEFRDGQRQTLSQVAASASVDALIAIKHVRWIRDDQIERTLQRRQEV